MSGHILALDPGEKIGWARSDWTCGTLNLTAPYKRDQGEALSMFGRWVELGMAGCVLLVIERPFGRHAASVITPSVLSARAHEVAFRMGIPRREMAVGTIRKLALGSGKAKKAEVLPAMLRAGWPCKDDHSADACALLMAAIEMAKVAPVAALPAHDVNCEFWHDQYPTECTCGVTRPRHPAFIPYSVKVSA